MYVCEHVCAVNTDVGVQLGTHLLHVILLISECNPFIVKPPEHVHVRQWKVEINK